MVLKWNLYTHARAAALKLSKYGVCSFNASERARIVLNGGETAHALSRYQMT